jgi:ABC-type sugar transport system substrate-binding protein
MKKLIAILLAALMAFSLFACSGTGNGSVSASPSPSVSAGASSPSASAAPSASPAGTSPSAPQEASAAPSALTPEAIGFFSDGVDPASRKAYNIVFEYPIPMAVMDNMGKAMIEFSKKLNFNLTPQCSMTDLDKYIQDLEAAVTKGTDGFIIMPDPTISVRIKEVLDEANKPYVALLNSMRDEKGTLLAPCVTLDNASSGAATVQWLFDNYKTYWGDIDTSKLGIINFTFSAAVELNMRYDAAEAKFKELFPGNTNIFKGDGIVTGNFEAQTGFDLASPVFSSHPDIKYWFVTSALEQYAQGAARAAESLNIGKNVLAINVGSDVLPNEWDNNYNGSWVACVGISNYQYTAPAVSGLIALLDGKETPETLWADHKIPGDKYGIFNVGNQIITKDTYKPFYSTIADAVQTWLSK